jgi:hypothetical protein
MARLEEATPLGYSCSGEVVAVGEDVEEFAVGDLVACARAGYANHAEVVAVPENLCAPFLRASIRPTRRLSPSRRSPAGYPSGGADARRARRRPLTRLGWTDRYSNPWRFNSADYAVREVPNL